MSGKAESKGEDMQKEKSPLSSSPRYGLRVRLILLVFIAVVPALILILHNAKRDRDVSAERIQEDAQRIVEIAASSSSATSSIRRVNYWPYWRKCLKWQRVTL